MSSRLLSSETVHASTVASDGRAVLISGPSGSGKSDLALRLLDRGFTLVSDDQTIVRRDGDRLVASAPPTIKGKLEIRGIGIVEMDTIEDVPVGPCWIGTRAHASSAHPRGTRLPSRCPRVMARAPATSCGCPVTQRSTSWWRASSAASSSRASIM